MIGANHHHRARAQAGGQSAQEVIVRKVSVNDIKGVVPQEAREPLEVGQAGAQHLMVIQFELVAEVDSAIPGESSDTAGFAPGAGRAGQGDGMPQLLQAPAHVEHGLGGAGPFPVAEQV